MDNTDYKSYKPRSLIFTWENDAFSHITEARKWEAALKANAHKNHQDEKMQALLNVPHPVTVHNEDDVITV